MAFSVELIDTHERFMALEKGWKDLLALQPNPDIFSSHLWINTFLDYFSEDKDLHILLLKDGKECVQGVAPLVLVRGQWMGLPLRILRFVSDPRLDLKRADFMFRSEAQIGMRAFMEYLSAHRQTWDFLDLNGFRSDSPHLPLLENVAREFGLTVSPRVVSKVSRVLTIQMFWDDYLRLRTRNFRRNLSKERSQLERLGTITFFLYRDEPEIGEGLQKMMPILLSRLQVPSLDQVNSLDRRLIEFTIHLSKRLSRVFGVEIRIMEINGRPAACLLSFIRNNVVYPFLTKYDPAFEAVSPGRAVIMNLVQDAYKKGYREIDFLSDWPYLGRFTPDTQEYLVLRLFHQGWFSQLIYLVKHIITPCRRRIMGIFRPK